MLFNIYVHNPKENTRGKCVQYADDTNAYQSFKPELLEENVQRINEDVNNFIVLRIIFSYHLSWNALIKHILSLSYSSLREISKLKRFTPYHTRKKLAEALILSRTDYGNGSIS